MFKCKGSADVVKIMYLTIIVLTANLFSANIKLPICDDIVIYIFNIISCRIVKRSLTFQASFSFNTISINLDYSDLVILKVRSMVLFIKC